ncbi:cytochrome-c peroxidase [bacterium]|nr:cytochrome-c peroxidase [bacterium]
MTLHLILGLFTSFSPLVRAEGPVQPLPAVTAPAENPQTAAKVALGKQLFFDPRLSKDGTVSCNSCHNVMSGGTDNRATSIGVGGKAGGRNSPTVWNAAFLSVQFWDGRAATLEEQAKGPLTNPIEMAMPNHDAVMDRVKKMPGYVEQFTKVFGKDSVNIDNLAKAIASYERTLVTPGGAFDKFLKGNKGAISEKAKRGYQIVTEVGCLSCHMGPNFAGPALPTGTGFYQKFPVYPDSAFIAKYNLSSDAGRAEHTKKSEDRGFFRVQSWRNIALTAPYFHNGSVKTLDEAVRVMAETQLNKKLSDAQVSDVVAFLETLTGPFPKQDMPRLPDTAGTTLLMD